ncbi:tyrosine-type recombinase/integrase [Paenibacillus cellulositrophicus]|uniref:tyrosine-type recombinase/integrase n=1 Tax=Paenibacillus cellulositrophicus TaxID=562959 RepID=UPI003F7D5666
MLIKFAAKEFIEDRELKNISKYTLDRYTRTLNEFQQFAAEDEILNVEDLTGNTIKKYLLYCQNEKGNNPTTKNSKLRVLKSFFNYLVECEYITEKQNPCKKVNYAKEDIKIEVFQPYHIKQMLAYYRQINDRSKSLYSYRDYVMILFLMSSGLRVGELSNLKWSDINFDSQTATVFGKKREQSSIPLVEKIVKELSEFKLYCKQYFKKEVEYVFPSRNGEQMTANSIKCVFKRLQKKMGFSDVRLSSHTFRHFMAHSKIMNGADVFTLQKMLRHADLEMSKKYLALWGTALASQNDKYNPLNNMDL